MFSDVISLSSALLAIMACSFNHQNIAWIRKQKLKKDKENMHKKANSLCTTSSTSLYTVQRPFSVKNEQNLVKKKSTSKCH